MMKRLSDKLEILELPTGILFRSVELHSTAIAVALQFVPMSLDDRNKFLAQHFRNKED